MSNKIVAIFAVLLVFTPITAQNSWQSKTTFPGSIYRGVAFTINNYGYVGTGMTANGWVNNFWRYDPEADVWSEIDSMPTLGRKGAFSFVINNRAYVGGGATANIVEAYDFWEYDPTLSKWSRKADIPKVPLTAETLTGFSIADKGYLLAAFNDPNFFMYDPSTDTWTAKALFPGEAIFNQVGFSIGDKGYIGTGFGGRSDLSEFWEYDPSTNRWSKKADVPGRSRTEAVGFSNGICGYIGLGSSRGGVILDDFWEYHPVTNSWVQIPSFGFASISAFGMSIGTKGYVGGGCIFSSGPNFWEYTPASSSVPIITNTNQVNLYPNPVTDHLNIETSNPGLMSYSIYNLHGQLVKSGSTTDRFITGSDILAGLYVLRLTFANQTMTEKFIKE